MSNFLTLKVKLTDRTLVERFRRDTGFTGDLYDYRSAVDKRTGKSYPSSIVRVHGCAEWITDPKTNWNIADRKSLTLSAPCHLSLEQAESYLIGLIDGDGSIAVVDKRRYLRLQLSGARGILDWAATFIDDLVPPGRLRSTVRPNGSMYDFIITGERAVAVLGVLDKVPVAKLERKWQKVRAFVETT
jgi:hypothetical protein